MLFWTFCIYIYLLCPCRYSSTEVLKTYYIACLNLWTGDAAVAEGTDSTRKTLVSLQSQLQLCIICQNDNQEKLMNVSHDGLQSVDNIRQLRTKLPTITFEMQLNDSPKYFKQMSLKLSHGITDCRLIYMSKLKVECLRKAGMKEMNKPSSSTSRQHADHQKVSLQSETPHIDWKQCIFCQQDKRESLLIQELPVSTRILGASKYDQVLSVRLACVSDLTAADGAYHWSCMVKFERQTKHIATMSPRT